MSSEYEAAPPGNVFADLGFADAATHKLKAELVMRLSNIINERGLTQTAAARLIGLSQPDLSRLLRGHFREMTADRLIRMLTRLDSEIEITVRSQGRQIGEPIHLEAVPA